MAKIITTKNLVIDGKLYWIEDKHLHGPFKTDAELEDHQRRTLHGDAPVIDMPDGWDKTQ